MTDKNAIKQWAVESMLGMLESNHPSSIGHAVLHALTGYEAARTGQEPVLLMSGGASPKLAPVTDLKFETVDRLIFDGLLAMQSHRLAL